MSIQIEKKLFYSIGDIKEIVQPLFKHFGATWFCIRRTYRDDGKSVLISTDPAANMAQDKEQLRLFPTSFERTIQLPRICTQEYLFSVWSDMGKLSSLYSENFGYTQQLGIFEQYDNYADRYCIASHIDNERFTENCLSQQELLFHFLAYWREQAKSILEQGYTHRRAMPISSLNSLSVSQEHFVQDTPIKHYYIYIADREISLTKLEMHCLVYLAHALPIKSIAILLGRSARTVENYQAKLRSKLACYTRHELVKLYWQKLHWQLPAIDLPQVM